MSNGITKLSSLLTVSTAHEMTASVLHYFLIVKSTKYEILQFFSEGSGGGCGGSMDVYLDIHFQFPMPL